MRIYLPATAAELAGADGLSSRPAHAVTPALRSESTGESEEDLEVAAFLAAADASLARLTQTDLPLRVVVSADVDAAAVTPAAAPDAPITEVTAPAVGWDAVVSIHIDDPADGEATALVRAAVGGDESAIEDAADLDLLWYDASERLELAAGLSRR